MCVHTHTHTHTIGLLGEELRDAGPGIDVERLGELHEVLHGDALVRRLFHGSKLFFHREVDALDDEVVGRLLASQHRPLLQKCLAVVVFSQPAKLLEVRLVFPVRRRNIMPVRNITPGVSTIRVSGDNLFSRSKIKIR